MKRITSHFTLLALGGVVSVAITSLCFSNTTFASSHNVNGIRYAIPYKTLSPSSLESTSFVTGFHAYWYNSVYDSNSFDYMIFQKNNQGECEYVSSPVQMNQNAYVRTNYFPYSLAFEGGDDCIQIGLPFDSTNHKVLTSSIPDNPFVDWINFGYQSDRDYFVSVLDPYWYMSSGFYTAQTYTDRPDREYFDLYYILGVNDKNPLTNSLVELEIPLFNNLTDDDCIPIQVGDYLYFDIEFLLSDSSYLNSSFDSIVDDTQSFIGFKSDYYWADTTGNGGVRTFYDTCNPVFSDTTVEGYDNPKRLKFENCRVRIRPDLTDTTYGSPYDSVQISLYWKFVDSTGNYIPYLYSDYMKFSSVVIRDNDGNNGFTCSIGDDLSGNAVIGQPIDYNDGSTGDWYYALTHLFSFNFLNPFGVFLSSFDNSSSNCAHISTLGDMLHLEDDTICPWFPQSVRDVVTPVLSLFSLMMIVAFIYHWLGSSSGNYIDDSTQAWSDSHSVGRIGKHKIVSRGSKVRKQ